VRAARESRGALRLEAKKNKAQAGRGRVTDKTIDMSGWAMCTGVPLPAPPRSGRTGEISSLYYLLPLFF
jgi:hypothetical protein